jgi:hypothetical protein
VVTDGDFGPCYIATWSTVAEAPRIIPIVIRNTTIIDCTGLAARPGMSALVMDGQIRQISPSSHGGPCDCVQGASFLP